MNELKGVKVAILITNGFEQVEMVQPREALDKAGANTRIVSPSSQTVRGWNFKDWGEEFQVDVPLDQAKSSIPTRCACSHPRSPCERFLCRGQTGCRHLSWSVDGH
jgi:hypothetical protein